MSQHSPPDSPFDTPGVLELIAAHCEATRSTLSEQRGVFSIYTPRGRMAQIIEFVPGLLFCRTVNASRSRKDLDRGMYITNVNTFHAWLTISLQTYREGGQIQ